MGDCKCLDAKVSISKDVHARLTCDCGHNASLSVGTVMIRDGTDDYEQLRNKPSIEGKELVGDVTLPEIKVAAMTTEEIERILYL